MYQGAQPLGMSSATDLEDLPGVGPATAEKLNDNGFDDYQGIAVASPGELSNTADIGGFESGAAVLERREQIGKLTWGVDEVDELLGGGVETQVSLPICSRRSSTAAPLSKPPMSAASRAALMMSAAVDSPMSAVFDSSPGLATAIPW